MNMCLMSLTICFCIWSRGTSLLGSGLARSSDETLAAKPAAGLPCALVWLSPARAHIASTLLPAPGTFVFPLLGKMLGFLYCLRTRGDGKKKNRLSRGFHVDDMVRVLYGERRRGESSVGPKIEPRRSLGTTRCCAAQQHPCPTDPWALTSF